MSYRFAAEAQDYTHFSSGRVLVNLPGRPAFPVRLTLEMFQRALALRRARGLTTPVRLYDPCCGGAYHLTTLAYFHWDEIERLTATDIDPEALAIARRNLALLTPAGLAQREDELRDLWARFQKDSHRHALASAAALRDLLTERYARRPLPATLAQADALAPSALPPASVDVVLTDLPYGLQSHWVHVSADVSPEWALLEALQPALAPGAIVAVAASKEQSVAHPRYQPVGKLKLGHRVARWLAWQSD